MTTFRPTHDRILVKREDSESVTEGGLIIPENAKVKSRRGEVIAVGPGPYLKGTNQRRAMVIEPGMTVCWRGINGEEIEINDEPYVILREDEVEGIVEK